MNESNSLAGTNPGTMSLINRLYGDKDAEKEFEKRYKINSAQLVERE